MFCVKFHVLTNDQVCSSCAPHGKSCGASAAALRAEYSLLCCAMLMAKKLFQVSHYTEEIIKKILLKRSVSAFPVCQMHLNFFEENSSSREHMWELQKPCFHGSREGRRKKRRYKVTKNKDKSFWKMNQRIWFYRKIAEGNPIVIPLGTIRECKHLWDPIFWKQEIPYFENRILVHS